MDVYVFLFTDLLLITKAKKGDRCRVLKPVSQVCMSFVCPLSDQAGFVDPPDWSVRLFTFVKPAKLVLYIH